MFRLLFPVVALVLLSSSVARAEMAAIYWGLIDMPPVSILSGKNAGKGIIDVQTDLYIDALPQYRHQRISLSLPRLLEEIKSGKSFCFAGLTRTAEREKFIDFAPRSMIVLPNGIVTSVKNKEKISPYLDRDGAIELDGLLDHGQFQLRVADKRSYSPKIDQIIKKHTAASSPNLIVRKGLPKSKLLIKQLTKGRIDGFLGRPTEMFYLAKQAGVAEQIAYYPVSGTKKFSTLQVGCAKGDWNVQFMKDLAKATYSLRDSEEFLKPSLNWIPANFEDTYRRFNRSSMKVKQGG